MLRVGIVSADTIRFCLNGKFRVEYGAVTENAEGEHTVVASAVGMKWKDAVATSIVFVPESDGATFTLHEVIIGIDFHWQRTQQQTFSGELHLCMDNGKICAINCLPVEDYLLSVISSEMSSTSSLQLLKAHAVISRSWVMGKMKKSKGTESDTECETSVPYVPISSIPSSSAAFALPTYIRWYDTQSHTQFDVCADDHCQRYQGIVNVNPMVCRAVEETCGEVLMYDDEVCDTRFSKCCGGMMEEFQNCWQDEPKAYIVGKPDIIDDSRSVAVVDAFCNTNDRQIISQVLNDYDQETADFYRWKVTYTQAQLSELVCRKSGVDFGTILSLEPVERGVSHRIVRLRIVGTKCTAIVGKELEIRKWLSETHLYSSAFDVEQLMDDEGNIQFVLNGRGWGHGVGLCQIGAAVMGHLGYDYREILTHYYPNSEIHKI